MICDHCICVSFIFRIPFQLYSAPTLLTQLTAELPSVEAPLELLQLTHAMQASFCQEMRDAFVSPMGSGQEQHPYVLVSS